MLIDISFNSAEKTSHPNHKKSSRFELKMEANFNFSMIGVSSSWLLQVRGVELEP